MGNEVRMTKRQIIEEPCEVKVSRTVLKTSGTGDSLAEFNNFGSANLEGANLSQAYSVSQIDEVQ